MFSGLFRRRTTSTSATGNATNEAQGATDYTVYSNNNELRDDYVPFPTPQPAEERPLRLNVPLPSSPGIGSPESPIRIGGYLLKKGHNFKVWKRRFFIFQGEHLEYRKGPDAPAAIGSIPLRHFDVDEVSPTSKDFTIITPGRHFFLRAETLQSKSNWVAELRAIQRQLQPLGARSSAPAAVPVATSSTADDHASVHCAKCKASFSLLRRKQLCAVCGYYYCSSAPCFLAAQRACAHCVAAGTFPVATAATTTTATTASLSAAAAQLLLPDSALAHLSIRVVEARDLRPSDRRGSADPLVVVYAGAREYRTAAKPQTLCPYWDEQFEVPLDGAEAGGVQVCVFDHDKYGRSAFLGMVHVPLASLRPDVLYDNWFPLRDRPQETDDVVRQDGDGGSAQAGAAATGASTGMSTTAVVPGGGSAAAGAPGNTQDKGGLRGRLQSFAARKLPFFAARGAGKVQGLIRLQLAYTYSPLCLHDVAVDESTRAALSKKLFSLNVRRAQRLWRGMGVRGWVDWYRALMQWRRPLHTITAYLMYNVFILFYPAEYVAVLPPLLLLCVLLCGYVDRLVNEEAYSPLGDDEGVYRVWEYRSGGGMGMGVGDGEGVYDVYEAWRALRSADEQEEEAREKAAGESGRDGRRASRSSVDERGKQKDKDKPREKDKERDAEREREREKGRSRSSSSLGHSDGTDDKGALFKSRMEQKTRQRRQEEEEKEREGEEAGVRGAASEREGGGEGEDEVHITFAVARELLKEERRGREGKAEEEEERERRVAGAGAGLGVLQALGGPGESSEEEDGESREESEEEEGAGIGMGVGVGAGRDDDLLGEGEEEGEGEDSNDSGDDSRMRGFLPSVERQRAAAERRARASATTSAANTVADAAAGGASPVDARVEKVSFLAQARRYHHILTSVQNAIGDACSVLERLETVLTWRDPRRASVLAYLCILAIVVVIALPLRLVLFLVGLDQVTTFFRRKKLVKAKYSNKVQRFIKGAPPLSASTLNNQSVNPHIPSK